MTTAFLVSRSARDPDVISVTEGWTNKQVFAEFFATEPAQSLGARLQPLLVGESQYTDAVPVGGKPTFWRGRVAGRSHTSRPSQIWA